MKRVGGDQGQVRFEIMEFPLGLVIQTVPVKKAWIANQYSFDPGETGYIIVSELFMTQKNHLTIPGA